MCKSINIKITGYYINMDRKKINLIKCLDCDHKFEEAEQDQQKDESTLF